MLTAGFLSLCWFGVDVNSGVSLPLLVWGDVNSGVFSPSAGLVLMLTAGFLSLCWLVLMLTAGVCLSLLVWC